MTPVTVPSILDPAFTMPVKLPVKSVDVIFVKPVPVVPLMLIPPIVVN